MMIRFWGFCLAQVVMFGCMGQARDARSTKVPENIKQAPKDTASLKKDTAIRTKTEAAENKGAIPKIEGVKEGKKKPRKKVPKPVQTDTVEQSAIWSPDQEAFLKSVDKIRLFHVVVTEIGSRKLELDSDLTEEHKKGFIASLMNGANYNVDSFAEARERKGRFTPTYQMLLENEEEKLTLMFDVDAMEMMVANLRDRKRYPIKEGIIEKINAIKRK